MEMRSHAEAVVGHLLAMQPFAPFDHCSADGLLRLLRARLTSVADNIEAGVESGPDQRLITMAEAWPEATTAADVKATLCGAFGGNDSLIWPHRDGLIWPRVFHVGVVVTV